MLYRLRNEGWSKELLEIVYFDEDVLPWLKSNEEGEEVVSQLIHTDSNGVILAT